MNKTPIKLWEDKKALDINLPPVIFGTSGLGNLFAALDDESKYEIVKECIRLSKSTVVFDSAGKYGAGLALEVLGKCLKRLNNTENIIISNKLGWIRTELKTDEPTFEPGVWKDLKYDAVQKINYDGIMECFEQGNELLGGFIPQMVSVHDPDEYLATAEDDRHAQFLYENILDAYEALYDLKRLGKVKAIGVGAKDWTIIRRIASDVALDWVMFANSMTIKNHPHELLNFIKELQKKGIQVINSAVFHSGFLVGGDYFDYRQINPGTLENDALYHWRKEFFAVCKKYNIKPAAACVQFALHVPGVKSIALNTTDLKQVKENLQLPEVDLPPEFWDTLKIKGLIQADFLNSVQPVL
jgi:D-threo-aldose 1-dehydrogenase